MKRDLAVKRGLGLEHGQEHFGKTTERVRTAVWPASVQVGGQRVSMEAGSIGVRHRPRYRPFACRTAFRKPFLVKCQVLRATPPPALHSLSTGTDQQAVGPRLPADPSAAAQQVFSRRSVAYQQNSCPLAWPLCSNRQSALHYGQNRRCGSTARRSWKPPHRRWCRLGG